MSYQLAQLNIGRIRYPVEDPRMAGFMNALDEINALAEATPGFVWRFISDNNNATSERPFEDDEMLLVNMSVWEDVESLFGYTYRSDHTPFLRERKQWFEMPKDVHVVLWWVPAGHRPTVTEAIERLQHLREHGASPYAFSFKQRFAAPETD